MASSFGDGAGWAVAVFIGAAVSGELAHAQTKPAPDTPAGRAVAARHQDFKQLGAAFKTINDQLKKSSPDRAAVAANTQTMKSLAGRLPSWFPKGSGAESRAKTAARPEVWTDPAGFAAAADRLQVEMSRLQQVAAGGDVSALRTQARATAGACKSCHDKYRVRDEQ